MRRVPHLGEDVLDVSIDGDDNHDEEERRQPLQQGLPSRLRFHFGR